MNASYKLTLESPLEFRDIRVISTKEEKCMPLRQINEITMNNTKLNHQKISDFSNLQTKFKKTHVSPRTSIVCSTQLSWPD